MPDGKSSLRHIAFKTDRLPVLDQQIFAVRITIVNPKDRLVSLNLRSVNGAGADHRRYHKTQLLFAPGREVRRMILAAVEAPRICHQTVRADSFAGEVGII